MGDLVDAGACDGEGGGDLGVGAAVCERGVDQFAASAVEAAGVFAGFGGALVWAAGGVGVFEGRGDVPQRVMRWCSMPRC